MTTFNTESSQMDAVDGSNAYIILTIGGNDVQFNEFATDCVVVTSNCDGSSQYYTTEGLISSTLPGNLDTLFGDIATNLGSSSTRVLVLGYPYIMPDSGSCSFLSSGEQTAATNVQTDLNGAIEEAVTDAGSHFEYVDPNATGSPFDGHQLCTSQPYFNGLVAPDTEYSFHPNADGHTAYAKVVTDYLIAHP